MSSWREGIAQSTPCTWLDTGETASAAADLGPASGMGVTVFAPGFLNDAKGPAFGLFAALPDGTVVPLPDR